MNLQLFLHLVANNLCNIDYEIVLNDSNEVGTLFCNLD